MDYMVYELDDKIVDACLACERTERKVLKLLKDELEGDFYAILSNRLHAGDADEANRP